MYDKTHYNKKKKLKKNLKKRKRKETGRHSLLTFPLLPNPRNLQELPLVSQAKPVLFILITLLQATTSYLK